MDIKSVFDSMVKHNASDAFVSAGSPLRGRVLGDIKIIEDYTFTPKDIEKIILDVTGDYEKESLKATKSCEMTIHHGERWRFRMGMFYQRNSLSIVIRKIDLDLLTFDELNLPVKAFEKLCRERRGLILLTGLTGSGKSTAIASMIEYINKNFGRHILTMEEPIEFTFKNKKSIINQRCLGKDVRSYHEALRETALHSPDVLYIGNIRDRETCHAALTAAETGVLVLSTVHTINAMSTIERIVNFFPAEQHNLIYTQLSVFLKAAISLRLLPRIDKEGLIPSYEIMTLSPTVSSLIAKQKVLDIPQFIASSQIFDMNTFNQSLLELARSKKISAERAIENSDEKENLRLLMRREDLL